jgi:hypothetical protein
MKLSLLETASSRHLSVKAAALCCPRDTDLDEEKRLLSALPVAIMTKRKLLRGDQNKLARTQGSASKGFVLRMRPDSSIVSQSIARYVGVEV